MNRLSNISYGVAKIEPELHISSSIENTGGTSTGGFGTGFAVGFIIGSAN